MSREILVAEDSPSYALLYKQMFESRGHKVTVTSNGDECVSAYKNKARADTAREPYDIVILDYSMPKKNGFEAATEILEARPNQRILFITSFGDEVASRLSDLSRGDNVDYLEKPFNSISLIQKVELEIEEQNKTQIVM